MEELRKSFKDVIMEYDVNDEDELVNMFKDIEKQVKDSWKKNLDVQVSIEVSSWGK